MTQWTNSYGEIVQETASGLRVVNATTGRPVLRPARIVRSTAEQQARTDEVVTLPFMAPRLYFEQARHDAPARGVDSPFMEPRPYYEQPQK